MSKDLKAKFHIVFQPKDRRYKKRKKFLISVNQLECYLGKRNAETLIKMMKQSLEPKFQVEKFRKYGKLWIYGK